MDGTKRAVPAAGALEHSATQHQHAQHELEAGQRMLLLRGTRVRTVHRSRRMRTCKMRVREICTLQGQDPRSTLNRCREYAGAHGARHHGVGASSAARD